MPNGSGMYRIIGVCSLLIAVIAGHVYHVKQEQKEMLDLLEKERLQQEKERLEKVENSERNLQLENTDQFKTQTPLIKLG
jgi:hypothetical protein